eukprot:TRINITY_DN25829_c0_g1_i2.p1 TRINITY_DN25829_c0_g1~~TRINITY_DN25829_c0_g1_i2.p1  ORF type:complete len:589 (-),score=183.20 TRINITY_DN25829_c0_g1_i2:23-1765(-)
MSSLLKASQSARSSPLAAAGRALASSPPTSAGSARTRQPLLQEEQGVLAQASDGLDALRAQVRALEARLRDELRPEMKEASLAVAAPRLRTKELNAALEALRQARAQAAEEVGSLSKKQLSEIRGLLRSPPEAVKRTLAAVWLLLYSKRFSGKPASAVRFDDSADWPRCQRMLADEGFAGGVLSFDPACLDEVPAVPLHVAAAYLGLPGAPKVAAESTSRRSSLRRSSTGLAAAPKPPLEVSSVSRASEPCGSLLRWVQELVVEHVERKRVQAELEAAAAELKAAEAAEAKVEGDVAEAEAALAKAKASLEEQEAALAKLKEERAAAEKAARDIQKLNSLVSPSKAAPKPKARPEPAKKEVEVELEVSGTLAAVEQQLAQSGIPFGAGSADILEGDAKQALLLPKIAQILKEHRGKLKLEIEGHQEDGEQEGLDVDRSLAVYQWLVEVAGCAPGLLRLKPCGSKVGLGRCAVPVPIQELVTRAGPMPAEQELLGSCPCGLYFREASADLLPETKAVLAVMGKCLKEEDPGIAGERAVRVRNELLNMGVSRSQLKAQSCKSLHPLSRTHPAANRRVEIHIV